MENNLIRLRMISVQPSEVGEIIKTPFHIISIQTGVQSHHYNNNSNNIGSSHANVAASKSSTLPTSVLVYISILTNITTCVVVDIP